MTARARPSLDRNWLEKHKLAAETSRSLDRQVVSGEFDGNYIPSRHQESHMINKMKDTKLNVDLDLDKAKTNQQRSFLKIDSQRTPPPLKPAHSLESVETHNADVLDEYYDKA